MVRMVCLALDLYRKGLSVMAALDILAPVLVIVAAIAAVAIAYLAFTALKDRSDRRRDEELMNGYRSKRR